MANLAVVYYFSHFLVLKLARMKSLPYICSV
uniref:Uncharacterized protein n=1 Tax=Siphoviridae sp. ctOWj17 TaxID=2826312 RepID=A0A8S5QTD9_9CAUD|nr:MAG TPA: hypothetical protein [Siphoviridae sp. ctOWj17]